MINNETTITVGAISIIVMLGINIYNFFQARFREAKQKGEEKGIVVTKLEEILKKIDSLTISNERIDKALIDLSYMVNDHEKRLKVLERRKIKKSDVDE